MHFADLHDTPGRMKAKEVIRQQVRWAESRSFFYWRLRRRLKDFEIYNSIIGESTSTSITTTSSRSPSRADVMKALEQLVGKTNPGVWAQDKDMVQWYDTHGEELQRFISAIRLEKEAQAIKDAMERAISVIDDESEEAIDAASLLKQSLSGLSRQAKELLLNALKADN